MAREELIERPRALRLERQLRRRRLFHQAPEARLAQPDRERSSGHQVGVVAWFLGDEFADPSDQEICAGAAGVSQRSRRTDGAETVIEIALPDRQSAAA